MLRRVIRAVLNYDERASRLSALEARVAKLEYYNFNRRFTAVEQMTEYLVGAKVPGDYAEFGVYQGKTFAHAYKWMAPHFPEMRYFAFDSFEGLPALQGVDATDGYSSGFYEGEFAASEEILIEQLKQSNVDLSHVEIVKGWFDHSLTEATAQAHQIDKFAAVWIDCDLYESTVPVLNFIMQRLSVGSIIIFDDWRCFRNLPDYGQQRACREWLDANPQITLHELFSFGWHGIAFTVGSC